MGQRKVMADPRPSSSIFSARGSTPFSKTKPRRSNTLTRGRKGAKYVSLFQITETQKETHAEPPILVPYRALTTLVLFTASRVRRCSEILRWLFSVSPAIIALIGASVKA